MLLLKMFIRKRGAFNDQIKKSRPQAPGPISADFKGEGVALIGVMAGKSSQYFRNDLEDSQGRYLPGRCGFSCRLLLPKGDLEVLKK